MQESWLDSKKEQAGKLPGFCFQKLKPQNGEIKQKTNTGGQVDDWTEA